MSENFYSCSRQEAVRNGELDEWTDSHRANIRCAGDMEDLIVSHTKGGRLQPGCARAALDRWGFQRVQFVLNSTLLGCGSQGFETDSFLWARTGYVPPDRENENFRIRTDLPLLAEFVQQAHAEYQALGMFGAEHCGAPDQDFTGKVLILRPDVLREDCWSAQNQLWYGECGFGCSPSARGRAVYATCLGDGEKARWNREDFIGVLNERYLPDWAMERLSELRGPEQEQADSPTRGGMEMGWG